MWYSNAIKIQVLATPMGKGVVDDSDVHVVGPARSLALQKADVVLVLGARLNWILHFGRPPRFDPNVKIIQVGSSYHRLHYNSILIVTNKPGRICKQI